MRHGKTFLAGLLALALIAPAALAGDHEKSKQKMDMETVEGTVQEVYTQTVDGQETVYADIKTEERPRYTVCLGEKRMQEDRPLELQDGDEVKVMGKETVLRSGKTVFVAHQLKNGDEHWKLHHHRDMHERHGGMDHEKSESAY